MNNELERRLSDLIDRSYRTNQLTSTQFLDPAEIAVATRKLRLTPGVNALFHGGFAEAERKRLFFLPDYIEPSFFPLDDYITAFAIKCKFGSPTHRDYLGALMALGIKRETLGDIIVLDNRAYIICTDKISTFIAENLTKVGNCGISCEKCSLSEIDSPEPEFDVISGTVASFRADAITSLAFGISRSIAADYIKDGKLSIDHLEEINVSKELAEGSLLSLRGYGRAKLANIGGTSKKGRHFIELHVFSKK